MTALGIGSVKVEINPTGSAWVDISSSVDMTQGVSVTPACASQPLADVSAGTAAFTLIDPNGTFWPGNPTSTHYPHLDDAFAVRVTGTLGSATVVEHVGRALLGNPALTGNTTTGSTVAVQSADILADLAGIILNDRFSLNVQQIALTGTYSNGSSAWDSWPLLGTGTDQITQSARPDSDNDAQIVLARNGAGSLAFADMDGSSAYKGVWNVPRMATFTSGGAAGPVLSLPVTASTSGGFWLAFRTAKSGLQTLVQAYDGSGVLKWWFEFQAGTSALYFRNEVAASVTNTGFTADGGWHVLVGYISTAAVPGAGQNLDFYLDGVYSGTITFDTSSIRTYIVGGYMKPKSPGKVSEAYTGDVAMLASAGVSGAGGLDNYAFNIEVSPSTAFSSLMSYATPPVVTSSVATVSSSPSVANFATDNRSILDHLRTLARSFGGQIVTTYATTPAAVKLLLPEDPSPALVAAGTITATIDLVSDADGALALAFGADGAINRVTVSSPTATAIWGDSGAAVRQDANIDTYAYDAADAYAIGGGQVGVQTTGLRIQSLDINLSSSATGQTLVTALLGLVAGQSIIRLTSLPTTHFGKSQADYVAVGWSRLWAEDVVMMSLRLHPVESWGTGIVAATGADWCLVGGSSPAEHVVTTGAALGTGTGTANVTSTGALFATGVSSALSWAGEDITGSFTGAASPQTLTVTARAQNGTVARTHANTDTIDVRRAAQAGF